MKKVTLAFGEAIPGRVAVKDRGVAGFELVGSDTTGHQAVNLLRIGPDILEKNGLTEGIRPEGGGVKIKINRSSQGISHNQHGGRQVIEPGVGMHTAFKIAIA